MDDLDEEELEDVEIVSRSPMLVGLKIDPDVRGEGSGEPLWRKDPYGIGVEAEKVIVFMNRSGSHGAAQTPISAHPHPKSKGDRDSLPLSRHPSDSTAHEGSALLADPDDCDDLDGYPRDPMRSSLASTVNSEGQQVSPRRTSYFS